MMLQSNQQGQNVEWLKIMSEAWDLNIFRLPTNLCNGLHSFASLIAHHMAFWRLLQLYYHKNLFGKHSLPLSGLKLICTGCLTVDSMVICTDT